MMLNDTLLEIQDRFTVHGRGLYLLPKAFLSIIPNGVPQPFTDDVDLLDPNGVISTYEACFQIDHFSLITDTGDIAGRFSLVIRLVGKSRLDVPDGSQIQVSQTQLRRIQAMIDPKTIKPE